MKVFIVVLIVGLFAIVSSQTVDKEKGEERTATVSRKQEKKYVKRHSYFNPNPTEKIDMDTGKPKSWGKGDCVIRAFCGVLDLPWEVVYSEICQVGAKCHDLPNADEPIERYANEKGLIKRTLRPQFMIYEPMASAMGIGLEVSAPNGNMIVDIGGGTTEIAVISLGGIVESSSIHVAGNELTTDIIDYLGQQHNISIGRTTAEQIKFAVGSILPELPEEEEPYDYIVEGKNLVTAHPSTASISYQKISSCIDKIITKIESEIIKVLQRTPPELYSNIVKNGIWLAGGGSLLQGIAKRFTEKVNIVFRVAEDPLKAVARGTCLALKGTDNYPFLMK